MTVSTDGIGSTQRNFHIIYSFTSPCSCIFDVEIWASTNNDKSYLNVDLDYDLDALKIKGRNNKNLTWHLINESWDMFELYSFGSFSLKEGQTSYLRITFLKTEGSWVSNIKEISLVPNRNQKKISFWMGFIIHEIAMENELLFPFTEAWVWDPNYIKVIDNEYAEFYYNQAAYDAHPGVRMYKGAELTSSFATNIDGWYGYQFYLPDKYPDNVGSVIITQMFNQGSTNSWAGHLHITGKELELGYRSAATASAETNVNLGELTWNVWYNVVVYFKVGRNNKGRVKVWVGRGKLEENEPKYD